MGRKMPFLSLVTLTFDLDLQIRRSEGPNTSSVWVWRKYVQRFPRYYIHKQKIRDGVKNRTFRSSIHAIIIMSVRLSVTSQYSIEHIIMRCWAAERLQRHVVAWYSDTKDLSSVAAVETVQIGSTIGLRNDTLIANILALFSKLSAFAKVCTPCAFSSSVKYSHATIWSLCALPTYSNNKDVLYLKAALTGQEQAGIACSLSRACTAQHVARILQNVSVISSLTARCSLRRSAWSLFIWNSAR